MNLISICASYYRPSKRLPGGNRMQILAERFVSQNRADEAVSDRISDWQAFIRCSALISVCFLLTSTSWLALEFRLLGLIPHRMADWMTMVVCYALQAVGIGGFALMLRLRSRVQTPFVFAALGVHLLCLIMAISGSDLTIILLFGFLMNLMCGYIGAFYLHQLAATVPSKRRATTLGVGYGTSILMSWLLSMIRGIYDPGRVWIVCLALTALTALLIRRVSPAPDRVSPAPDLVSSAPDSVQTAEQAGASRKKAGTLLPAVGVLVTLFSIVNNIGFAFPSVDVSHGIRVEFSRLFYAAGLLLAGLLTDRNRRHGAVLALSALALPFVMMAFRSEPLPATVLWALSYFVFGFYSVFRMIVFADIAEEQGLLFLSGFGLMLGRVGDVIGEALCLSLSDSLIALVVVTAVFFAASMFFFFRVYGHLYAPVTVIPDEMLDEAQFFHVFAARHDLSQRECEVLRLLLQEKTSEDIAESLSVSDSTVKFHIHNLLKKTGCRNRLELLRAYMADFFTKSVT